MFADVEFKVDIEPIDPKEFDAQTFTNQAMNKIWEKEMIRRLLQEQWTITGQQLSQMISGYGHEEDCICVECLTKPNNKLNEDTSQNKV